MVKFIKVAFKKDMINVSENGAQPVWYDCDPKAKGFAKTAFKEGDDVELVSENRGGKIFVTQVRRPGQGGQSNYQQPPVQQQQQQTPPATNTPATQEPPRSSYSGDYQKPKTPAEVEIIVRQSTMAAAAQSVQVLTGQVQDPLVLSEIVIGIYQKLLAEIKRP